MKVAGLVVGHYVFASAGKDLDCSLRLLVKSFPEVDAVPAAMYSSDRTS